MFGIRSIIFSLSCLCLTGLLSAWVEDASDSAQAVDAAIVPLATANEDAPALAEAVVGEATESAAAVDPEPDGKVAVGAEPESVSEGASETSGLTEEEILLLGGLPVDNEIVVMEEFGVETEAIKPPELMVEDASFETMRDLSLQAELPVVYAPSATSEEIDTYGIAAEITQPPAHGELRFPEAYSTAFFYLPEKGFIGEDEFHFTPFSYHLPEFRDSGNVRKEVTEGEWVVRIRVNQLPRAIQTRSIRQDLSVERQINILFVIDNSQSMAGEQKILASSFDRFIKGFLDQRLDFRIGVLTTDATNVFKPEKRRSPAVFGAGYLQLTQDALGAKEALDRALNTGSSVEGIRYQPFLDNRTPELTARFQELAQVGTTGSPNETAIVPIMMSYVEMLSPGAIEHNTASFGRDPFFYQPEAFLSIVIVSDEDEAVSRITPVFDQAGSIASYEVEVGSSYLAKGRKGDEATRQYIASILKSLQSLKRDAGFRIDAVTHPRKGVFFSRLAEQGGGQTVDISRDFSNPLIEIGESIARQASRTFRLPDFKPDEVFFEDTIRVAIDGQEVAEDAVDGWVFNSERQTVELRGQAGEASFGAVVRIDFDVEYQP
ncbi:MAG: hypothetical protein R3F07_14545 [Opitutaceae bacterium]